MLTGSHPLQGRFSFSHIDETPRAPILRADRALIRWYITHNALKETIRSDMNISDATIRRAKRNAWGDNVEDDHIYLVKQEGGAVLAVAAQLVEENEVIEISSDSDSDSEEEDCDEVSSGRKSRMHSAPNPEQVRQPQKPLSGSSRGPAAQFAHRLVRNLPAAVAGEKSSGAHNTSGKRVRFDVENDESDETKQKRQKKANIELEEYRACIDCHKFYLVLLFRNIITQKLTLLFQAYDGSFNPAHKCSVSGLECSPQKRSVARHGKSVVRANAYHPEHKIPPSSSASSSNSVGAGPSQPRVVKVTATPSRTKTAVGGPSVNSINLDRLSLDPMPNPGSRDRSTKPLMNVPENAATQAGDRAVERLLTNLGLPHCKEVFHKAGYKTLDDIKSLKETLAKEKPRGELRSILMSTEGGGMIARDWFRFCNHLAPHYGE
ncbi:hypothetical protein C8R44DRAFT_800819 [Mycena epipterygia]|nr:hypothetical protein C8R44DRAFT_800819 [Mycena epipterygia]